MNLTKRNVAAVAKYATLALTRSRRPLTRSQTCSLLSRNEVSSKEPKQVTTLHSFLKRISGLHRKKFVKGLFRVSRTYRTLEFRNLFSVLCFWPVFELSHSHLCVWDPPVRFLIPQRLRHVLVPVEKQTVSQKCFMRVPGPEQVPKLTRNDWSP